MGYCEREFVHRQPIREPEVRGPSGTLVSLPVFTYPVHAQSGGHATLAFGICRHGGLSLRKILSFYEGPENRFLLRLLSLLRIRSDQSRLCAGSSPPFYVLCVVSNTHQELPSALNNSLPTGE